VAEAGRGRLDDAATHWPDLVVLELMLPGMDGLEVCRRMRGVEVDGKEMSRVLGNLLVNAIRRTPPTAPSWWPPNARQTAWRCP
jgi:CheY-like chemotaxis protein